MLGSTLTQSHGLNFTGPGRHFRHGAALAIAALAAKSGHQYLAIAKLKEGADADALAMANRALRVLGTEGMFRPMEVRQGEDGHWHVQDQDEGPCGSRGIYFTDACRDACHEFHAGMRSVC